MTSTKSLLILNEDLQKKLEENIECDGSYFGLFDLLRVSCAVSFESEQLQYINEVVLRKACRSMRGPIMFSSVCQKTKIKISQIKSPSKVLDLELSPKVYYELLRFILSSVLFNIEAYSISSNLERKNLESIVKKIEQILENQEKTKAPLLNEENAELASKVYLGSRDHIYRIFKILNA